MESESAGAAQGRRLSPVLRAKARAVRSACRSVWTSFFSPPRSALPRWYLAELRDSALIPARNSEGCTYCGSGRDGPARRNFAACDAKAKWSGGPDSRIRGGRDRALLVGAAQDSGRVQKKRSPAHLAVFRRGGSQREGLRLIRFVLRQVACRRCDS